MKPISEQIEWLEQEFEGVMRDQMVEAILSTLRAHEAAEKELPEEPRDFDLLVGQACDPACQGRCRVCPKEKIEQYISDLRAYAVAQKVREHD